MAVTTGIPVDAAALMSSILGGILYGLSVLMFIGNIWVLTYKRRIRDVNRPVTAAATLFFILNTAYMVVVVIRADDGLIKYRDTFPGGPSAFFADVSQKTFVVQKAIVVLQTLLGDGVVIYRCYVVWQSARIIILPSMMWCGIAATGVRSVYGFSQEQTSDVGNAFTNETGHWFTAFMVLTLVTNLCSSGLLAYRIWMMQRKVSAIRTKGKLPILRVIVDAAILYSVALCATIICFALSNNGVYIMGDLIIPIISIAFYMVFIRLMIATRQNNQDYVPAVLRGTTETDRRKSQQYPMQPVHTIYRQNDTSFLANSPKVPIHPLV